jgi:hypothetical protein
MSSLRGQLYRAARDLGDLQAARSGRLPQRLVRKAVLRKTNGATAKLLRRLLR